MNTEGIDSADADIYHCMKLLGLLFCCALLIGMPATGSRSFQLQNAKAASSGKLSLFTAIKTPSKNFRFDVRVLRGKSILGGRLVSGKWSRRISSKRIRRAARGGVLIIRPQKAQLRRSSRMILRVRISVPGQNAIKRRIVPLGAAVGWEVESQPAYRDTFLQHFDQLTPENQMKMMYLQPERGSYHFAHMDRLVEFATSNNKKLRAHTLVWGKQLPAWL